jgi:hypothetical protein
VTITMKTGVKKDGTLVCRQCRAFLDGGARRRQLLPQRGGDDRQWPEPDKALVNVKVELAEELIKRTVEDMDSILKLIKITPTSVTLFCAPAWKWHIFRIKKTTW